MRVAVVGSRGYPNEGLVRAFVRTLAARDPKTVIISGGARGVDTWAADEARKAGLDVEEYLADWDRLGRTAGFARNTTIVEQSDVVVAFHDGRSRGTLDTIRKTQGAGKRLFVLGPDSAPR